MKIILHGITECAGEFCVVHNPSEHHMREWPTVLRTMLSPPIFERNCPHGVGHPDPDSAAWAERAVRDNPFRWQNEISDGKFVWQHGCDGCCVNSD